MQTDRVLCEVLAEAEQIVDDVHLTTKSFFKTVTCTFVGE